VTTTGVSQTKQEQTITPLNYPAVKLIHQNAAKVRVQAFQKVKENMTSFLVFVKELQDKNSMKELSSLDVRVQKFFHNMMRSIKLEVKNFPQLNGLFPMLNQVAKDTQFADRLLGHVALPIVKDLYKKLEKEFPKHLEGFVKPLDDSDSEAFSKDILSLMDSYGGINKHED